MNNKVIMYEYKDVTVKKDMVSMYLDGYRNFGWTLEKKLESVINYNSSVLKLKRSRDMKNKDEINKLQDKFEKNMEEIERLEFLKGKNASIAAYSIGLIGTAFMAGAVFAQMAGMIPLMIVLAVPGFAGWAVPYFLFKKVRKSSTKKANIAIEEKSDIIYGLCTKACELTE